MPDYFDSPDGFRIAYDVYGDGPPLVLLHGLSNDRRMWGNYGIIQGLQDACTVITLDMRGCGDSQASDSAADYSLALHMEDVLGLLAHLGHNSAAVWGWSLGGTLALHLASYTDALTPTIVAGASIGQMYGPQWREQQRGIWEPIAQAKADNQLHTLSEAARPFAARTDFNVFFARLDGYATWPAIQPTDLKSRTVLYTGTNDGRVFTELMAHQDEIHAAGHQVYLLSNFNHVQLVMQTEIVLPTIRTFLGVDG